MFSQASVILFKEGACTRARTGQTPPCPWADTSSWTDTPQADAPCPVHAGIHTPLPSACFDTPPSLATVADGTHPTRMHYC